MIPFLSTLFQKLKSPPSSLWFVYVVVYFLWGMAMNEFGAAVQIAKFTYWWQVITCYILYMIPISILLKDYRFFDQYAYGLVAMGALEFLGYALETSYAYPDNILDHVFNIRNFSLGMALFFALYFPIGNWAVQRLHRRFFEVQKKED